MIAFGGQKLDPEILRGLILSLDKMKENLKGPKVSILRIP